MTPTTTSGEAYPPEALHRVIDDFERRERGIPQAHIAAALVTELRAALAAGQATAQQAGEYPALVCDYCGALTPDPWHSSGMLHGKMSKHIHSCDACAARVAAQAQAQADSVPAVSDLPPLPAPDLRDVGTKPQEIKEFLKGYATEYARTAIAARAPADIVQEDAACWHWLAEYLVGTRTDLDDELVASETVNDLRNLVEAAIKQGEKQ